jgi:hypothetical protein
MLGFKLTDLSFCLLFYMNAKHARSYTKGRPGAKSIWEWVAEGMIWAEKENTNK